MAAQFRYESRSERSGRRRLFFATLLVLVLILIDAVTGGKLRGGARGLAAHAWSTFDTIDRAVFQSGYFSRRRSLEDQIRALQDEAALYQEKAASYDALAAQYASLSAMDRVAQAAQGVTAPIASSVRSSPYGTFLVGAGSADGVTIGNKALTSTGFVIGVVADVSTHTALVKEALASGSTLDVHLGNAELQLVGSGGSNATVKVPRGIVVDQGDTVFAPEYGDRPIGIVQHVEQDAASAYGVAYVGMPVNISSLSFVYITP